MSEPLPQRLDAPTLCVHLCACVHEALAYALDLHRELLELQL